MHSGDKRLILLTGASGFLGSYVAETCRDAGHELLGVDIRPPQPGSDWLDFCVAPCEMISWERFLRKRDVEVVFHLAAGASVPESMQDPYRDFATSLPGTANLLASLARHHASTHFVFFSSAAVYGNPGRLPVDEDSPVAPLSPYGIHKACSEFLLQSYARLYNLRTSILRIFSAFGPGLRKQLFWDLASRACGAAERAEKYVTLEGTGRESRDFIYATDIARAALCVANRPRPSGCEFFNVASGRETTTAEAASLLCKYLGLDLELAFTGTSRPGDPLNWCADITRLARIGFRPEVSLSDGIRSVAHWMKRLVAA